MTPIKHNNMSLFVKQLIPGGINAYGFETSTESSAVQPRAFVVLKNSPEP